MENHSLFGMHESTSIATELVAVGEELAKTSAKIDSVELALSGHGAYLGITDKNKLMSQLEVLQTKEAQLQKKELLIMGAASAAKAPPTSLTVLPASGASTTSSGGLPSTVSAISAVAAAAAAAVASAKASSHGYQQHLQLQHQNQLQHQDQLQLQHQNNLQHRHQLQLHHGPKTPPLILTPHQLLSQAMLAVDAEAAVPVSVPGPVPSPDTRDTAASAIELSLPPPTTSPGVIAALPAAPPSLPLRPSDGNPSRDPRGPMTTGVENNSSSSPSVMESFGETKGVTLPAMAPPATTPPVVALQTVPAPLPATLVERGADPSNESLGLSLGVGLGLGVGTGEVAGAATGGEDGLEHPGQAVGHVIGGMHVPMTGQEQMAVVERTTVTPVKRRGVRTGHAASSRPPPASSKKRPRLGAQCLHPGCTTARTFGHEGAKDASFCAVHKEENMVNIKGRRCHEPGCPHRPGFAMPGDRRGKFCATHRLPGMVDVVSRKCQVEGGECNRQPVYGWPGERATRCGTHKLERTLTDPATGKAVLEKMHDVRGKRCQEPGCIRQPGFGDPVKDKGSVRCNEHKLPGMTNVRKRRAMERLSKVKDPSDSSFYPQRNHSQAEILHSQRQAQAAAAIAAAAAAAAAASAAQQQATQAHLAASEEGVPCSQGVGPVPALGDYYESFQATQTGGASFDVSSAADAVTAESAAADAVTTGVMPSLEMTQKSTAGGVCSEHPHSVSGCGDGSADLEQRQQQQQEIEEVDGKQMSVSVDQQPQQELREDISGSVEQTYHGGVSHAQLSPGITGLPTSPVCAPPEELGGAAMMSDGGAVGESSGEELATLEVLTKAASNN